MKRVIIMRHAKSSWKDSSLSDHDRPLNKRGKRDAPRIAKALYELGWIPDLVLSSTSERTRETWHGMEGHISDDEIPVKWLSSFYHGGTSEVLAELAKLDDSVETVLCLGHNPGWEDVVASMSNKPTRMTTANAVLLESESSSWCEDFAFVDILRPKELD